jgi:formylglycine-generating enzyme
VSSRNAGAAVFVPTEHEWYKAAYYDPQSGSYFDYPAGFDAQTTCTAPTAAPNAANCGQGGPGASLTPVGSYPGSPSPYGTFDQGGNVFEFTAVANAQQISVRGGAAEFPAGSLAASHRPGTNIGIQPFIGFRLGAAIPEPGTGFLVIAGLLGLAASRRRSRASCPLR